MACDELLSIEELTFCHECLLLLEYQKPSERCPICFAKEHRGCPLIGSPLEKCATVFEKEGPILKLVQQFTQERIYLAKGIAAYMAAFWLTNENPLPDLIVPIPVPWNIRWRKRFNQNKTIAAAIAKIMGANMVCPLVSCLQHEGFVPKAIDPVEVQDKSVLLITLENKGIDELILAAKALQEGCPRSIYALTFV